MSKKLLRTITEKQERLIKLFNKNNKIQAKHGSIKVKKLKAEGQEAYERAVEAKDFEKAAELLGLASPTELYLKMPDLKVSENGSIRSLNVALYSAQVNDSALLHRLLGKTKEQS